MSMPIIELFSKKALGQQKIRLYYIILYNT